MAEPAIGEQENPRGGERGAALRRRGWWTRLLILPPLAAGAALLAVQMRGHQPPAQGPALEIARPVRVVTVSPTDLVPRAFGYGQVQPGSVWNAVAQVGGKVIERHPDLEPGKLFKAGTVLLRIDPADYQLAVAQTRARLQSVRAQLGELDVRAANIAASLAIERRALALAEKELLRRRTLRRRNNVSQTAVDESERQLLAQQQKVQELESQLNLIPAERQILKASLAVNEAQLEDALLDLQRTTVRLPFDARIAEVMVEESQFVNVGTVLFVADSIDVAEVSAQVPIEQMAALVRGAAELPPLSSAELGRIPERLGLRAVVELRSGWFSARWEARVDRIGPAIDPQTRTVGVVVAVDEPYRQAIPGKKPALVKNMYVQVALFAKPWPKRIVIPRVALHRTAEGAKVYLVGGDNRLVVRPIEPGPAQGDLVVIEAGLAAGERVVVSDLIPASEGMLLAPSGDNALEARMTADATHPEGFTPAP